MLVCFVLTVAEQRCRGFVPCSYRFQLLPLQREKPVFSSFQRAFSLKERPQQFAQAAAAAARSESSSNHQTQGLAAEFVRIHLLNLDLGVGPAAAQSHSANHLTRDLCATPFVHRHLVRPPLEILCSRCLDAPLLSGTSNSSQGRDDEKLIHFLCLYHGSVKGSGDRRPLATLPFLARPCPALPCHP